MPRNCNCAGPCGPQANSDDAGDGVTRREFIALGSIGAAGALLGGKAARAAETRRRQAEADFAAWKAALRKPSAPRVYRSNTHTDARMPLGGIGTGNFELGADGQITTWQLFNTLRDGYVPLFFGVQAGKAGKTAKLLQTAGGPEGLPRVAAIEMTGDYPFAFLRFVDPELPVELELTAFSPFAPLDSRFSAMPVACFVFKAHNPTKERQTVSLAAFMQNPVGYDAMGVPISFNSVGFNSVAQRLTNEHPNFGGNVNEVRKDGGATVLSMRAEAGKPPTLDKPLHLYTNLNVAAMNQPFNDRPENLTLEAIDRLNPQPSTLNRVIWLEDAAVGTTADTLRAARDAVRNGATLVFSGGEQPLLKLYGEVTKGKPLDRGSLRPDIVFEDFESGYGKWKVEGDAFGAAPATGTLQAQQEVQGFLGKGYANSYVGGDDSTGRLVSQPFTIERRFIRFLVGGGNHPNTQIRLVADGKTVRAASGRNEERLLPAYWDVSDLRGRQAHVEIVDEQKGGWGHINVDQIEFTDLPGSVEAMELLDELVPLRFSGLRSEQNRLEPESLTTKAHATSVRIGNGHIQVSGKPDGASGIVTIVFSPILPPSEVELTGARQHAYATVAALSGATYTPPAGVAEKAPGFGTLALATLGSHAVAVPDAADWNAAWSAFERGALAGEGAAPSSKPGQTHNGALASTVAIEPGKTVEVPFFLAWRYPNKYNHDGEWMGCHYAEQWPDADAVIREVTQNWPAIRGRTERFRQVFYDSTLPHWLLDAITSQASTIRHIGVLFRIANADTYGWEGSNGCCDPTCTHVWGYEQTLARLFPDLERDMRRIDLTHQQNPDGGINNRTHVPSPPHPTGEHPFTDGHASCVLKCYREAMNHPEEAWLRERWPNIKRAVEYLIGRDAATSKGQPNGLLEDDQWNTYDEALHGVTTFIGTYYLAALRAGEELAYRVGDPEFGNRCRTIFEDGQRNLIKRCWNGEYFQQDLPGYEKMWGEVGPGCMSDQVIGQWWAHQLGLGYLLPPERVKQALQSVYKYNWKPDLTGWKHMPRAFAGAKDKGLIICTWPKGGRPANVMLYSDEVWTGIEYQVAAHMVCEGMVDEGLAIVKGLRDRYDGRPRPPIPRNPWNEIECGGHYARAMSSWSVLLALSGFELDGPAGHLRFTPRITPERFKSFFTGPEGWGSLRQTRRGKSQRSEVAVVEGQLRLARLHLAPAAAPTTVRATVNGKHVAATLKPSQDGTVVALTAPIVLTAGDTLAVTLSG